MLYHCFLFNCQSPANASGKKSSGNLILIISPHSLKFDDQSPEINGIKKSRVMETKKEFFRKALIWFPIPGCTKVKARKKNILPERNPLLKKRLNNMITML